MQKVEYEIMRECEIMQGLQLFNQLLQYKTFLLDKRMSRI